MAATTGTFQELRQVLQRWDRGSTPVREEMLHDFVTRCEHMTGPELEQQFCDCASLFLARLTSWLRITFMFQTCLKLQMQAIGIFVTATSGYLSEFLEVGGVLTLLEIVGLRTCGEWDKAEALRLLTAISDKGRQYKEMICESYGVKVVAECLAISQSEETQECAQHMLHQLAIGNPRYQSQVYKSLIKLLSAASPEAQRLSAYTIRLIQPSIGMVDASIVEPLLQLLKSLHSHVQHEAGSLVKDLLAYEEIQQMMLMGLVTLLKPEDTSITRKSASDGSSTKPLPSHLQQAGSARIISTVVEDDPVIADKLVEMNVVPHLLFAMGNTIHSDSQRQSSMALSILVNGSEAVKSDVLSVMGDELFHKFTENPSTVQETFSLDHIDNLVGCLNLLGNS